MLATSTSLPLVAAKMNAAAYRVEAEPVGSHSVQYTYVAGTARDQDSNITATSVSSSSSSAPDSHTAAASSVSKRLAAPSDGEDVEYKEYQGKSDVGEACL